MKRDELLQYLQQLEKRLRAAERELAQLRKGAGKLATRFIKG